MNNNTTAYTPLESLFLFQLLPQYGFINGAFNRISDELKNTPLIREQDTYDPARLSPDALHELALQLLREEQRREAENVDKNGGGLSPTSRKRKLQSPPLPTIEEAHKYTEKLPILVDRLYARFRENIVQQIRDDEHRIDAIQREMGEIEKDVENSKIDGRPQTKDGIKDGVPVLGDSRPVQTNGQPTPTPSVPVLPKLPEHGNKVEPTRTPTPTPASVPIPTTMPHPSIDRRPPQPTESPAPSPVVRPPSEIHQVTPDRRSQESIPPPNGTTSVLQHPQTAQGYGSRPVSTTPHPPSTESLQRPESLAQVRSPAPPHPPQSQTQTQAQAQAQAPALKWEPPYQPAQSHQTPIPSPRPPYNLGPSRPPSYPPPAAGQHQHPQPYPSGRQAPTQFAPPSRASPQTPSQQSPPVLFPPHTAPQLPPSLPSLPPNATPDGVPQQVPQRRPSVPTPGPKQPGVPPPSYTQSLVKTTPAQAPIRPPTVSTPTPQPSLTTGNGPVSAGPWPPLPNSSRPPKVPIPPHTPVQQQQQHQQPQYQKQGAPISYPPSYAPGAQINPVPGSEQRQPPPAHPQPIRTPLSAPQPTHSASLSQPSLGLNISSHVIRGHGTKWVSTPTPATPRMEGDSSYFEVESPAFEPLSPPLRPVQRQNVSPNQGSRKKDVPKIDTSAARAKTRQPRSTHKATSTLLQAEGTPTTPDIPRNRIKEEEATPRVSEDGGDTTADESVQGRVQQPTTSTVHKRKREDSPIDREPPGPPTHVLWTRSFNKVSASALEQVISHRHANMFAHAVKEREAPGYRNIVLQPQDLNNIRRAINQGHKAATVAATTLSDVDPNAGSIWLPISVELVPPRGIINIAQLEREIVHMFANAIMYAPDPNRGFGPSFLRERGDSSVDDNEDVLGYEVDEDAIVKDTRSMFVEVEKLLSDLRNEVARNAPPPVGGPGSRSMSLMGGEASAAEDETDELAGDAKRRRVRG